MRNVFFKKGVKRANAGFTLIEILVVIGIIALLATIVIIAINPARQFAQARNTQRQSNINTVLNAIGQNIADNKGLLTCGSGAITTSSSTIVNGTTATAIPSGMATTKVDLSCLVPIYVSQLASDPDTAWAVSPFTGYDVSADALGRITVCAPRSIMETQISNPGPTLCVKR